MGELLVFKNEDFGEIRTADINGKPYFMASDIATALGYAKPNNAISMHCRATLKQGITINGKIQEVNFIPEGDIYRLIVKSKLPSAEKFESWVFDEVLPSIRKTGGYVSNDDMFINTYLPFVDETTKLMFKSTLETVRKQNDLIEKQSKEIKYHKDVVIGLVEEITLAEKRQILNRVVKHNHANYRDRWAILYREFDNKFHMDVQKRMDTYNINNKPKCKNKLDYIDRVLNQIPDLYDLAVKLFENDVNELVEQMYKVTA